MYELILREIAVIDEALSIVCDRMNPADRISDALLREVIEYPKSGGRMNGLQTFANEEFGAVRSLMIEDMPWFVGRDVATALGYAKPRNAISVHVDDEDKNSALIQGAIQGGTQGNPNMTIINESGLYSLILSSKLHAAKRFKRWVTSEVLPAIRRTGGYGTATQAAEPETVAAETLPARETMNDDYLRAASIVASCKNERLPCVLAYLSKAGLSTV